MISRLNGNVCLEEIGKREECEEAGGLNEEVGVAETMFSIRIKNWNVKKKEGVKWKMGEREGSGKTEQRGRKQNMENELSK